MLVFFYKNVFLTKFYLVYVNFMFQRVTKVHKSYMTMRQDVFATIRDKDELKGIANIDIVDPSLFANNLMNRTEQAYNEAIVDKMEQKQAQTATTKANASNSRRSQLIEEAYKQSSVPNFRRNK